MSDVDILIAKINISLSKVNQLLERYKRVLPEKVMDSIKRKLLSIVQQLIEIYNMRDQFIENEALAREYFEKIEEDANSLFLELCQELNLKPETFREPVMKVKVDIKENLNNNLNKRILELIRESLEKGETPGINCSLLVNESAISITIKTLLSIITLTFEIMEAKSENEDEGDYESTLKEIFPNCPERDIDFLNKLLCLLIDTIRVD